VEQYRAGKHKVLGFLVGQVMKASKGTANPQQVNAMMREKLDA
jgi:aspartyl-tRNA(Asn)/glutamyl-tRNA(Gln) amidotransferase subunit B